MFKTRILQRSFSLFNRGGPNAHVIRAAARDGHESIRIQRVRFRKPFLNRSRLIGTTIGAAAAYAFMKWLEETPEEEAERRQEEEEFKRRQAKKDAARALGQVVEEDEDEEENEDVLLFLPTGLSRPKPQRFYKGSDPEWQEFVRIGPDRQRIERIRGELIALVRDIAIKNPQYTLRLGKINPAAGTSWIEFKFPDGPPIEYERPGIELTEDGTLRRSTRPVNELHHHRLSNILVPTAVAKSVWADSKRRIGGSWRDFKVYVGWEDASKPKLQNMFTQFPPPQFPRSPQPPTPTTTTLSPPTSTAADSHLSPSTQPSSSENDPVPSAPDDPAYERFGLVLPKPTALTLDLSTFRQAFRKEHKHYNLNLQPPRGTFMVSGLIEIIGDKARMTLDVSAAYDPKVGKFVMLKAQLRSVTPYRQDPRGGP